MKRKPMKKQFDLEKCARWWIILNSTSGVVPAIHQFQDQDVIAQRYGQWAALDAIPGVRVLARKLLKSERK